MVCMECGAIVKNGYTTSVTDLGNCLLIVRNVPCHKCTECNEIIYTGDVIKRLEQIAEQAEQFTQEISIVDYSSAA
ncbi:MAG: YgiT-type zinc finger protein [Lachnospiraceae bacterium]|nr:YgiT-type zinc finger protein [Lachnospiraceae bacterium]RKI25157.1 YgiT-type zinc finger protein [bacterium D16-36]RKI66990.1 YgiT-type zinc finger protein [bacterium 1xD8-6]